jgi:hypothetical protein
MRKQQHSIREPLLIAGRKTTIVDEIHRGADVRTQIIHGKTLYGLRPERHLVIIRDGHYADEYEISDADFRQLRAMGVLAEAEQVSVAAAGRGTPPDSRSFAPSSKDADLPGEDARSMRAKAAHARRLADGCMDRLMAERLRELADRFEGTAATLERALADPGSSAR